MTTSARWQRGMASQLIMRELPYKWARVVGPELRRDCPQQAPAIVPHDIGRAILPSELAARFVEKDCARRMIPGEAALEYREVVLTQHESRILLSSAAGNVHGFEVPFRACLHVRTLFGGHEKGDRKSTRLNSSH